MGQAGLKQPAAGAPATHSSPNASQPGPGLHFGLASATGVPTQVLLFIPDKQSCARPLWWKGILPSAQTAAFEWMVHQQAQRRKAVLQVLCMHC